MAQSKTSKIKKTVTRNKAAKKPSLKEPPIVAELRQQLAQALQENSSTGSENTHRLREVKELLEQRTATSEILGVIAGSPTNVQRVLDALVQHAAHLCQANDAQIGLVEGNIFYNVTRLIPTSEERTRPVTRDRISGRAFLDRQTIHITDLQEQLHEYPESERHGRTNFVVRSVLATPLMREAIPIGVMIIRRTEVRPFSESQIDLIKTFANQAVIAIENARLFEELKGRNRQLTEALEQQTATSDILSVISGTPADLQPVFNAIAKHAVTLCGGLFSSVYQFDGDLIHMVGDCNYPPAALERSRQLFPTRPGRHLFTARAILDRSVVNIPDVANDQDFTAPDLVESSGFRSVLSVPMLRGTDPIGAITVWRAEIGLFSSKHVALLQTFADQAVIAIENARLFQELKHRTADLETSNAQLTEALDQQTATSEILGVIAGSPTDIHPIFETILENAVRLCDAQNGAVFRFDGEFFRVVLWKNVSEDLATYIGSTPIRPGRESALRRVGLEKRPVHIPDMLADPECVVPEAYRKEGMRSNLAVPLLKDDNLIGAIAIHRHEVRPFTAAQIRLLETFASQAVIAIENVRLFKELQERNAALREALEHQTATSEVLGIISRSPTDVQPVLAAIVESAAKVCGIDDVVLRLRDGDTMVARAHFGPIPMPRNEVSIDRPEYHWIREHGTLHVPDAHAQSDFPTHASGARSFLIVPLRQQGEFIGSLNARRIEVRPFTPAQIKLLETFADQAVIAIENVRLFNELKESLEQQTATSQILGVIASSPTDIQPVLDTVANNAARLCEAADAQIRLIENDRTRLVASFGSLPAPEFTPISLLNPSGRAILTRQTLHVHDLQERKDEFPLSQGLRWGLRTFLSAPMIREGTPIGVINIRRMEVRSFSERHVKLLETFARQAVIAIENVRLFKELQERNTELHEALEHQTATSEVLGIISRSPTDVQPVLDAIVESAAKVCGVDDVVLRLRDGGAMVLKAHIGPVPVSGGRMAINIDEPRFHWMREHGTHHIPDLLAQTDFPGLGSTSGSRTLLRVPLRHKGELIGTLGTRRIEVRPFTPAQIKLLETFADQAVIAIENVRLFNELKESLEQQTATSEILGVIASSPTDVQPVLETIADSAARLCSADDASIRIVEGDILRLMTHKGSIPFFMTGALPITRGSVAGRAVTDNELIHIEDLAVSASEFPDVQVALDKEGVRTILVSPLEREGRAIGVILIRRTEVRPFTEKQIALLKTFAAQAVIAIENVRLFQELEARTRELARSVGELRALGEVGQAVSSTLELETVLTRIVSHAVQLSGTDGGAIYEYNDQTEEFLLRATHHMDEELINALRANPPHLGDGVVGRAAVNREPIQVPNILEERAYTPRMRQLLERHGFRASLAVPLLREDRIIGGLVVRRKSTGEFRPEVIELMKTFATQSVLAIQNARLFREIEDKSHQIEAANRHKSEFLANMSHELRTPLNAIIGFSEVLQEKLFGELNEKQTEYTGDILTSGQHLLSLINEILDLSKVEAGRMELETATFDLPLAIDNARTFVRERATKHGITLDVSIDERLGDFVGDERKIKQILLNLLSNAVKFTPEGGRIKIDARQTDGAVEISVSDTGVGIAPDDLPKIFEEFRQVGSDYAHKSEGTGLGLTLAKKFVELHGGKIWVTSKVGIGSTFTFTLPTQPSGLDPGQKDYKGITNAHEQK